MVTGRGVRTQRKSQLVPLGLTSAKCRLHFLSLVQKERPQERTVALRLWQGHTNSSLPPGRGGNGGGKESLLRRTDGSACKAPRGREDAEYQKIVVSYLVLIPLLASCPGSTIHGRLARVFCSDGSICFKRERLMPVMRYLYGRASMRRKRRDQRSALAPRDAGWEPLTCSFDHIGCTWTVCRALGGQVNETRPRS